MLSYAEITRILGLLVVANGAPILARDLLWERWGWPLDLGSRFVDGRPLLGPSKTIRGVMAAIVATGCTACLFGMPAATGAWVGLWAMIGDLLSSFIKRRLGIASSDSALGLDQGLEALVPTLVMRVPWRLSVTDILVITALFFVVDVMLSRLLYKLHIRQRPL